MSVKSQFNWISNQRVDVPHLKMIDSSVNFDFTALLSGFVGTTPYILNGFSIYNSPGAINGSAANIQIIVSGANVWMPADSNGSFLNVPTGTANEVMNSSNSNVVGSFTAGATNYLSVVFTRAPLASTADLVAAWDVDAQVEFSQTVPLGNVMNYQFVINTTGFGTGAPIAIITTDNSNNVLSIENAKQGLFRLGTGGTSPNPAYSYTFTTIPENPLIITSPSGADPFVGGDWQISSWKDWMNAVMSQLQNLSGSAYWYSNGSSQIPGVNISDLYFDTCGSKITGSGSFLHSYSTPGQLIWTSNVNIRSIFGSLTYVITQGSVTLSDGDVAYISLIRNQNFQPSNTFTFTNGSSTVSASAAIVGINPGDWIKASTDTIQSWGQVQVVSGTSITLTTAYTGSNVIGEAVRSVGTYSMLSASPGALPVSSDTYWMAKRDDNAIAPLTIAPPLSSGATRTFNTATITTTSAHGLVLGQTIAISGVSDSSFDGTFVVASVLSSTSFTYANDSGADVPSGTAGNGTVSSVPKIYLRLGGGNTELEQGEDVPIDDNTNLNVLNYIGSPSENVSYPTYASHTVVTQGASLTAAISQLDAVLGAPSFSEYWTVVASSPSTGQILPVSSGGSVTLPLNSRLPGSPQQYYIVGKGNLEVRLNGIILDLGIDWFEVGSPTSASDTITIDTTYGLVAGDVIEFRLITGGSTIGGGGGGGTLQLAYNGGNTITTVSNTPMTVVSGGGKAAAFIGDIEVTGLIDPSGMVLTKQSTNPLGSGNAGIYVDNSGNFITHNGTTAINVTQTINTLESGGVSSINGLTGAPVITPGSGIDVVVSGEDIVISSTVSAPNALSANFTNSTGSTIPAGTVVYTSAAGQIGLATCTNVTPAASRAIGITTASIAAGSSGPVAYAGYVLGVLSGLTHGNYAYLSDTPGEITDTPPVTSGYEAVILGVIEGNNLLIQITNVGTI